MHVFDNQTWILGAWLWGSENVPRAFGRNFYSTFLWCLWLINPSVIVPYLSQQVATNCGGRGQEYLGNNRWVSHRGGLVGWRSWHYYRVTRHKLRALVTYCSPFHSPALPHCGRFSTDGDLFAQLLTTMELSDRMVVRITTILFWSLVNIVDHGRQNIQHMDGEKSKEEEGLWGLVSSE